MSESKKRINQAEAAEGRDRMKYRLIDLPDQQITEGVEPIRGEIVLQKTGASAFPTTGLEGLLRQMDMRYLVFAGRLTDGCLGATAFDAYNRAFLVTIAEDACDGANRAASLVWLRMFDQKWGRVRSVDEVIAEFEGRAK
jgi:nicotinamidase-related amidase